MSTIDAQNLHKNSTVYYITKYGNHRTIETDGASMGEIRQ